MTRVKSVESVRISDGLQEQEITVLQNHSSREIIRKLWWREKLMKKILDKIYHFNRLKSIASIYDKAKRNRGFAALLQLYLKVKWKYASKIDGIFWGKSISSLMQVFPNLEHKEYSSILKLEKMKEAIRRWKLLVWRYKVNYAKLLRWKKKWINVVKMKYAWVNYDNVKIDDAIKLYKEMKEAWELNLKADEAWVKYAKNHRYNYKKAREKLLRYGHENYHNRGKLKDVVYWAKKYLYDYHVSEHDRKFVKKMKEIFGLDITKWKDGAWCDIFVELLLNISWVVDRYHLHWRKKRVHWEKERYTVAMKWLSAAWALWFQIVWAHIWVSLGNWRAVYGNDSRYTDRVAEHAISQSRFLGWVYPWDYGKRNKVHWAKNVRSIYDIPAWAIIVQTQVHGGQNIERRIRPIAGYLWWKHYWRKINYNNSSNWNYYSSTIPKTPKSPQYPNPLDVLRS